MAETKDIALETKPVEQKERAESTKYTFIQAVGLNTMNMFGTGPLITIPYCIASVEPMGTHAMFGYGLAALACMMDSFIWGELGSMWPHTGGSILYLKETYGGTAGSFMAFMFVWQFLVSGPAEVASGFIAIAEYLAYFSPDTVEYGGRVGISLALTIVSIFILYRKVEETGKVVQLLWVITIIGMIYTFCLGFGNWDGKNLESKEMPTGGAMVWAMAAATRFGVYDMTGYYDVNSLGDEVQNPKRTIPLSCIATCFVVGVIYILIYVAILGCMPWSTYIYMYTDDFEGVPLGIMSVVTEQITKSTALAGVVTVLVAITIFGSTFAQLCGYTYLLQASGKEGYFFEVFGHMHEKHEGLADYALLCIGSISAIWCFFSLDQVIDAMVTLLVMIQFVGQSVGLMYYRYRTRNTGEAPEGWRMPLFPLPCIFQCIIFCGIFITSDSVVLWGSESPTLELSLLFLFLGSVMFLLRETAKLSKNLDGVAKELAAIKAAPAPAAAVTNVVANDEVAPDRAIVSC